MPAHDHAAVPTWSSGRCSAMVRAAVLVAGFAVAACASVTTGDAGTTPRQALQAARQAVQVQDSSRAVNSLDVAEQDWLGRSNGVGNPELAQAPAVLREIGNARAAVRLQRWDDAMHYIDAALTHSSADSPD